MVSPPTRRGSPLLATIYGVMITVGIIAPIAAVLLRTQTIGWPIMIAGGLGVSLRIVWLCGYGPLRSSTQRLFAERKAGMVGSLVVLGIGVMLTLLMVFATYEMAFRSNLATPCVCTRAAGLLSIPVFGVGVAFGSMMVGLGLLGITIGVAQLVYTARHRPTKPA